MTAGRKHHTITDGELGIINKHRRDTREDWEFGRREIIRYQREECLREQYGEMEKEMELTPVFLLRNPMDRTAWWATVYQLQQSWR